MLRPANIEELCEIVAAGGKLRLRGGGSKDAIGAPTPEATIVDMRGFAGVVDYDPPELVLTVGAGTPLTEVQALVAAEGQMLAFDPFDHGALLGGNAGEATIGGVIAAGVSGPGRLSGGAARDHLLGFTAVSGRGERFVAGAKVVKNVTGYDLPKLIAGSFGTLVAMTEVTLKVVPAPEATAALTLDNLSVAEAQRSMILALGSTTEPTGAVYQPSAARLIFRLEGSAPSVAYRLNALSDLVGTGTVHEGVQAVEVWQNLRHLTHLIAYRLPILWSLSIPPADFGAGFEALLNGLPGATTQVDWGGGRIWLAHQLTDMADAARTVHRYLGGRGHATLLLAPDDWRRSGALFTPEVPIPLLQKIRAAFDPGFIFNRGRLHPDL